MGDGGRVGNPEVLAELGGHHELGQLVAGKELARAKGHVKLAAHVNGDDVRGTRHKVTALIELVVGGQVPLGHDAQNGAAADHGAAVVELGVHADGQAHQKKRVEVRGATGKVRQALVRGGKKRVLPEEVLAGVGGEAELGQRHHHGAVHRAGRLRRPDARVHVEGNVSHPDLGRHGRDLHKPVLHASSLVVAPGKVDKGTVPLSTLRCLGNGASADAGQSFDLPDRQAGLLQVKE